MSKKSSKSSSSSDDRVSKLEARVAALESQMLEVSRQNATAAAAKPAGRGKSAGKNMPTTYTAYFKQEYTKDSAFASRYFKESDLKKMSKEEAVKKTKEGTAARANAECSYLMRLAKTNDKVKDKIRKDFEMFKKNQAAGENEDREPSDSESESEEAAPKKGKGKAAAKAPAKGKGKGKAKEESEEEESSEEEAADAAEPAAAEESSADEDDSDESGSDEESS